MALAAKLLAAELLAAELLAAELLAAELLAGELLAGESLREALAMIDRIHHHGPRFSWVRQGSRLLEDKYLWWVGILPAVLVYNAWLWAQEGMRTEIAFTSLGLIVLILVPRLHSCGRALLPLFVTGYIYEGLRYITPWLRTWRDVLVREPYELERSLFGIPRADGSTQILCEYFQNHTHLLLDLLGGFAYGTYLYEPFLLALVWVVIKRYAAERLAWGYFVLSLSSFIIYYVFPAAPPWYVEQHGLGPVLLDTVGNPARLQAVDQLLGIEYFSGFYRRAANVFAAIPSLHAGHTCLVWLYARQYIESRAAGTFFFIYWISMCFAAVYLRHHYVLDVVIGSALAWVCFLFCEWMAGEPHKNSEALEWETS